MIRTVVIVAVLGTLASGDTAPMVSVQNVLTTIDSVPSTAEIDQAFQGSNNDALAGLLMISGDSTSDVGIRLRAVHALAKYCVLVANQCPDADPAHTALFTLIGANQQQLDGSGVLVLRAAIEAIGPLQVSTDLALLEQLLGHSSRDVRATTAHAIGDLCLSAGITPLRARLQAETIAQVQLAISAALTVLAQCGT